MSVALRPDLGALCARLETSSPDERHRILTVLEDWHPQTEAEWRKLDIALHKLGKQAWREIMVERFLEVQPEHLPAQIVYLDLLTVGGRNQQVADKRTQTLITHAYRMATHMDVDTAVLFKVARGLRSAFQHDAAIEIYRRVLARDRAHMPAWNELVMSLISVYRQSEAVAQLSDMRCHVPETAPNLAIMAERAHGLRDKRLFRDFAGKVLHVQPPANSITLARVLRHAAANGATKFIQEALNRLIIDEIADVSLLRGVSDAANQVGRADIKAVADARLMRTLA